MVVERRHPRTVHQAAAVAAIDPSGEHAIPSRKRSFPRRFRRKRSAQLPSFALGIWSSRALLLFVAIIYSSNFASVKYLETLCLRPPCDHDPAEACFCRFLVSALVCLPILWSNRKERELLKAGVECGVWYSVNYICQAEALEYIPAGKCAFISALSVVTVPLFAGFFLGRPIRPMSLVSAAIALFGVAILENVLPLPGGLRTDAPVVEGGALFGGIGKGDLLALGQPLGFGYAVMRIDYYLEKFQHIPNRVLAMTAAQCCTVCVLSALWVLYDTPGYFNLPDLSYMLETKHVITLAWTGIVTCVLAIILQGIALEKASATDASLIFSTDPVWGSMFAGWLLQERLSRTTYIGGAFIMCACILGSLSDGGAGHGGGGGSNIKTSSDNKSIHRLKHKNSNLSEEEGVLPTHYAVLERNGSDDSEDPDVMRKPGSRSVPRLADAIDTPPTTNGKQYSDKAHAYI